MEEANLDDKDKVVNSYVDLYFFSLIGRDIDSKNDTLIELSTL